MYDSRPEGNIINVLAKLQSVKCPTLQANLMTTCLPDTCRPMVTYVYYHTAFIGTTGLGDEIYGSSEVICYEEGPPCISAKFAHLTHSHHQHTLSQRIVVSFALFFGYRE